MKSLVFIGFAVANLAGLVAIASEDTVDYLRDIKPIFKSRCYACHGALKQEGGLRLDTAATAIKGGESGAAIKASDPNSSYLIERITDKDETSRMPQGSSPLSAEEIVKIKQWIEQGARTPANDTPEPDPRDHWAFKQIRKPPAPDVSPSQWQLRFGAQNPIDSFIAAEYQNRGLQPVAEADKATLLRRVYLDLIGLPPSRGELHAFLADDSPDAYEKLVERLLASPQYGERWGRHWMDVWRYSDWYGRRKANDVTNSYPMIWRWRDWIVNSLNDDKGYDRMIVEMLAADEVTPEEDKNIVATGFLVRNYFRWNYNQWMKDNVEHTAKAFLGLTLNCAHCHDHKYDPISQEEYFAFRAFFEPLELRHDRVLGSPDPGPYKKYVHLEKWAPIKGGMIRVFDERLGAQTRMYSRGDERNVIEDKLPVTPRIPAILGFENKPIVAVDLPPVAVYPGLKPFIAEEDLAKAQVAVEKAKQKLQTSQTEANNAVLIATEKELTALQARIVAGSARFANACNASTLAQQASKAEREAAHARAISEEKLATIALTDISGKPGNQKDRKRAQSRLETAHVAVETAASALVDESDAFTLLTPVYPNQSTGRRSALARAIVDRENPLTARVAVNHIWMRHFGKPLVESVFDFGRNGKSPSHPDLLDWLAAEFMDSNWSMKHLHRLIVTSATYRLASAAPPDSPNFKLDPDNHFFWQFTRQRMQAEVVRDSILRSADQLNLTQGGPEIEQPEADKTKRRSLYISHHGERRAAMMETFNSASPMDCYRRIETVVPQQALAIANDDATLDASRALSRSLWEQTLTATPAKRDRERAFVGAAYEQLLTRLPKPQERAASLEFLKLQVQTYLNAETAGDSRNNTEEIPPSTDPAMRARESLVHSLYSHHDFISVR